VLRVKQAVGALVGFGILTAVDKKKSSGGARRLWLQDQETGVKQAVSRHED
jgi:hypothetical protein